MHSNIQIPFLNTNFAVQTSILTHRKLQVDFEIKLHPKTCRAQIFAFLSNRFCNAIPPELGFKILRHWNYIRTENPEQ